MALDRISQRIGGVRPHGRQVASTAWRSGGTRSGRGEGVDPVADLLEVDLGRRGAAGDPDPRLAAQPAGVLGRELVGIGDVDGLGQDLARTSPPAPWCCCCSCRRPRSSRRPRAASTTESSWRVRVTGQTVFTTRRSWHRRRQKAANSSSLLGRIVDWLRTPIFFVRGTRSQVDRSMSSTTTCFSPAYERTPLTSGWSSWPMMQTV